MGAEGADGEGAVVVHLEAYAGVDAIEERPEDEPRAEEGGGDGGPGAPKGPAAPAVLQGAGGSGQRQPGGCLWGAARGGERRRRRRRGAGEGHGEPGAHVSYPVGCGASSSADVVTAKCGGPLMMDLDPSVFLHRVVLHDRPIWMSKVCLGLA